MYFPDLTEIESRTDGPAMFRMGWLERGQPFPTGRVPAPTVEKLRVLCAEPVALTRGFHCCDLCNAKDPELGNGEIHVSLDEETMFVAPQMILHYIEAHDYCPHEDFLRAVNESPLLTQDNSPIL